MNPFLDVDGLRLFEGDAASVLAELPDASVDLCVTSPPFGYPIRLVVSPP